MHKEAVKGTKWKLCYYLEKIILTPKGHRNNTVTGEQEHDIVIKLG